MQIKLRFVQTDFAGIEFIYEFVYIALLLTTTTTNGEARSR